MSETFWKGEPVETLHRDVLIEILRQQHFRLEALEAALREIVAGYDWCMENQSNHIMPSVISEAIQDGRAALAPEPDK